MKKKTIIEPEEDKPTKVDSLKLIGRNLLNREDAVNNYEYISTPANFTLTYERSF